MTPELGDDAGSFRQPHVTACSLSGRGRGTRGRGQGDATASQGSAGRPMSQRREGPDSLLDTLLTP